MSKHFRRLYIGLVYAFLYIPIVTLIILSLNDSRYSVQWHGITWDWYRQLLYNHALWSAFANSLLLGITAATIATLLGTLAAVCLVRYRFYGRDVMYSGLMMVIVIPDIMMGIALLIGFNLAWIPLGFFSLLLAHITFCIPFVVLVIMSRIKSIDSNIYEAAIDLGASELKVLTKIVVPLLKPAIIAGFLLSFTLSFDDVIVSYFVSGPSFEILPLKIYSMIREGITPEINALCSLVFAITIVLVSTSHKLVGKVL